MANYLSIFSFELQGFGCLGIGVYDMVMIVTVAPFVLAAVGVIVGGARLAVATKDKERRQIEGNLAWALLFLSYIVIPPVSMFQFQVRKKKFYLVSTNIHFYLCPYPLPLPLPLQITLAAAHYLLPITLAYYPCSIRF